MGKKVTLTVNGSRFDIDLEENFARYMDEELESTFNVHGNNDIKSLLQAYIQKNYELYEAEQKLQRTLKKVTSH
jgi:hypothetical protein